MKKKPYQDNYNIPLGAWTWAAIIVILAIAIFSYLWFVPIPARADIGQSIYDGYWDIEFIDCQGNSRLYLDCKITDADEVFITFKYGGRSHEVRLPVQSSCSTLVMERKR